MHASSAPSSSWSGNRTTEHPTAQSGNSNNNKGDDDQQQPYHDAQIAATLSQTPFSDFCKLRDDWAAKPLVRGRYNGLSGGDPKHRERREDFELITLRTSSSSAGEASLPGQVEAYSRSAAGKTIDPHCQRTPLALEKSMHFLVEHYLRCPHTPLVYTDPVRIWGYLWNRLRGIRTTWAPQLPPSNASVAGYVDNESAAPLSTAELHRESYRRVRWLEFTAAALAVGGAYLCLTPQGCQRFLPQKKQFLESIAQCFTDLTVFYRAEQRHRNAEFFSVLLLLYGLNQEMKVEDRATFCRFDKIQVNGQMRECPESPAASVNLAQVNRELERQPYMLKTQHVRAALELIYCWSSRRWFGFFALCKSSQLTPLQRAVVFQSFTYARYRAVLDLVLPNLHVYPKLRVRYPVSVDELADQLMMAPAHCLQFLKAMGLTTQLELKVPAVPTAGEAPQQQQQQQQPSWHLNVSNSASEPLVTAEELEQRCSSKQTLFLPTYPEFFGFRVWHEAYTRFPTAAGLARPGDLDTPPSGTASAATTAAAQRREEASPAGRGATRMRPRGTSAEERGGDDGDGDGFYAGDAEDEENGGEGRYHSRNSDRYNSNSCCGSSHEHNDDEDDDHYGDDDDDGYYRDDVHDASEDEKGEDGSSDALSSTPPLSTAHTALPGEAATASSATATTTTEAALLRRFGCPVNLMEVLEVYCPPYHPEVRDLALVDTSQALFASLQQHRSAMLRVCRESRRRARHWQDAVGGTVGNREEEGGETAAGDEEWVGKREKESVSTCSSFMRSGADDSEGDYDEEQEAARAHATAVLQQLQGGETVHNDGSDGGAAFSANVGGADESVLAVIAAAERLVGAVSSNALYEAAAADQAAEAAKEQQQKEQRDAAKRPPLPHIPRLSLPLSSTYTVEPLPDNHSGSAAEEGRCTSQNSRVVIESPASAVVAGGARGFRTSGNADDDEDAREGSAETVEPHAYAAAEKAASPLFPGRPNQPALVFGGAKAAVPPMQFNTTMPSTATTAAAVAGGSGAQTSSSSPFAALRGDTTATPIAARGGARLENDSSGNKDGEDSRSSSSSSAPQLDYSHLKRRSHAHGDNSSNGGEEEAEKTDADLDVFDKESSEGDEDAGHATPQRSATAATKTTRPDGSAAVDHEVDLPPPPAASAAAAVARSAAPWPAHLSASAVEVSDAFTPPWATAATQRRRQRGDEREAATTNNGNSCSSSEDEAAVAVRDGLPKRRRMDALTKATDPELPLALPLASHEVNVFASLCVPLVEEYLQLWTLLTHNDAAALQTAAACVLRARDPDTATHGSSGHGTEVEAQRRCQRLSHTLAKRARELLTTSVLRGSMSEGALQMWDIAARTASASAPYSLSLKPPSMLGDFGATPRAVGVTASTATNTSCAQRGRDGGAHCTPDVSATRFCRGCSAATIADYEARSMLAVEAGAVPIVTAALASRGTSSHLAAEPLSSAPPSCLPDSRPRALSAVRVTPALSASLKAALNSSHIVAAGARLTERGRAEVHAADVVKALEATMKVVALSTTDTCMGSSHNNSASVVFDASSHQCVAQYPSEAAVLQLTSTFVLISSAWRPCSPSRNADDTTTAPHQQQQREALESVFCKAKERWLAQLLLPSPEMFDAEEDDDGSLPDGPYAGLRNTRALWLCAPTSVDARNGPVLRLFQRDHYTNVPIRAARGGVLLPLRTVPLATRVGLYACDVSTLPRLRVRRDGGIRLESRTVTTRDSGRLVLHPSMVTSLAMSHAHYTAVVAVDLEEDAAVVARTARRTLAAIVDSHVPVLADGATSANSVAGVLLCCIHAKESEAAAAAAIAATARELEEFFWQRWEDKHGEGSSAAAHAPAVVRLRLSYGDATTAAAAVAQGMQTVLATYAQQAAAVLAEA